MRQRAVLLKMLLPTTIRVNDGVVENPVEVRKIGTSYDMFIGKNYVVVGSNDTNKFFRFIYGNDGVVLVTVKDVTPKFIAHLIFGRINCGR